MAKGKQQLREALQRRLRSARETKKTNDLSRLERGLWTIQKMYPTSTTMCSGLGLTFHRVMDLDAVRQAFQTMLDRHAQMRTRFPAPDGYPVREIPQPGAYELPFEVVQAHGWSTERLHDSMREAVHQPVDFERGPLVRAVAYPTDPDTLHVLFLGYGIAADGYSLSTFLRELGDSYTAITAGQTPELPPLTKTYQDFVRWQRDMLASAEAKRQLDYWKGRLSGELPLLDLPTDMPRPMVLGDRKLVVQQVVGREVTRGLEDLAAEAGVTLYALTLAAYITLLHRYCNQDDLIVGCVAAGSARPQFAGVVGPFTNLLPIRAALQGPPTFVELAKQVYMAVIEGLDSQDYPFQMMVEAVAPPRDPARNPIFQTSFTFQKGVTPYNEDGHLQLGGDLSAELSFAQIAGNFDCQIELQYDDASGTLGIMGQVNAELFNRETARRLLVEHFIGLLRSIIATPHNKLHELPLVDEAERDSLMVRWNQTDATFEGAETTRLEQLLAPQVAKRPDAVALIQGEVRLRYRELDRMSTAVALRLAALGARPGQLVGVVMDKGWEQVVAACAILKAGAAYLPVDPNLPPKRVIALLEKGEAAVVLTQPAVAERLEWPESITAVALDRGCAHWPTDGTLSVGGTEDLAYVIFTSGSTGFPKGVMLNHRGPVNTILDINSRFDLGPADRVLGVSSLSFDLSVWDLFGVLGAGGTLVLPAPGDKDPAHWAQLVREHGVTVWNSVPKLMELLVEHAESHPGAMGDSLRLVMMSGDWIPVTLPDRIRTQVPASVVSLGGATEASIWSIIYPIGEVKPSWRSIPYGGPMANQRFYVLDHKLEPCPVGIRGELYIGGVGVALGYYGDEAKTAASFFEHPRTGERIYRTGDLGRYLADGNIEFLGRADFQVKLRGYRVELGEVESVLLQHPAVREAVAVIREDSPGDRRMVAYVILEQGQTVTHGDLRTFLKELLPDYMVPSAHVMLDAFPLTDNGKLNRRALPAPEGLSSEQFGKEYIAPRDLVEQTVAQVWADVLKVPRVGIHDDFFDLGGESLLTTQVVNRLRKIYDIEVPVRLLLENPTLGQFAGRVSALRKSSSAFSSNAVVQLAEGAGRPFFCVHPVGGDVVRYRRLAAELAGRRPLIAIRSPYLEGEAPLPRTVEALAASYIDLIANVDPDGPYLLGGWSMGGCVAFEMTRQLQRAGKQVKALVLIDSEGPALIAEETNDAALYEEFVRDLEQHYGGHLELTAATLDAIPAAERRQWLLDRIHQAGLLPAGAERDELARLLDLFVAHSRAERAWRPTPVAGDLVLLRASTRPDGHATDGSWGPLVEGEVHVTELPGDHYTMLAPPNVTQLAQALQEALDRHDTRAGGTMSRGDGALPLSFSQERLWFLDALEGSTASHIPMMVRLTGELNHAVLQRTFDEIVRRHEALRTCFVAQEGTPVQVIHPPGPVPIQVLSQPGLDEQGRVAAANRLAEQEIPIPFDLAAGPMLRITLLQLAPDDHVLLIVMHHIVTDGWSIQVLADELSTIYTSFLRGEPPRLPGLPVQYADYAVWQRNWLQGDELKRQMSFWRDRLQGHTPLELPTDRPRPPVFSGNGSWMHLELTRDVDRLEALGQQHDATLHMTLLAVFATLLARTSGQHDICIGSPVAGRNREEIERLIGFFVNTLVLRIDLSGDPSFSELLHRTRDVCLDAYAHQDLPFEKVVEELQPERHLNRSPVYQVLFILQSAHQEKLSMEGLGAEAVAPPWQSSQYDLTLSVEPTSYGLRARVEYATDLFQPSTIERWIAHYRQLLDEVLADPERPIAELPLMQQQELEQLVQQPNETATDYPSQLRLDQLFAAQAARTPDAVALRDGEGSLTYAELERRSNRLAQQLRQMGVARGAMVGVYLNRSVEMVVALLGILKAGGAYVPMDPDFPSERLSYMVQDAGARLIVTQPGVGDGTLQAGEAQLIDLDTLTAELGSRPDEAPAEPGTPDDLAYIIYTSGSTGKPKGVAIRHRGVVNFLCSMAREPGICADDVVLAVTTISFDISVLELFLPLVSGASAVIATKEQAGNGQLLTELIQSSGATLMQATPATWKLLLDCGWAGNPRLKVLCGGEALSRELARSLAPRVASLWNMYGPTETTVWSAVARIHPDVERITLGHPIANTQLYVLDPQRGHTPVGCPGELYIGGDGLARGYFNRPELTQEKFVEQPWGPGSPRLYRTGDLVRRLADGRIEFIGRIDFQTKIRGYRIELGEIASVLLTQPGIQDAVAVVREQHDGDKRLVAFYVVKPEAEVSEQELRRQLKTALPAYMVPSRLERLNELPLSTSGKVDRGALQRMTLSGRAVQALPEKDLERRIAALWADVLDVPAVGLDTSFFDLGGHSLLIPRLVSRMERELGQPVAMVDLFRSPTVRALAQQLEHQGRSSEAAPVTASRPEADGSPETRAVAIIGMAGRFPLADSVDELWRNLRDGRECFTRFSEEQLLAAGTSPDEIGHPAFVPVAGMLQDAQQFDAEFFGMTPRDAQRIDPQHRLFYQCAWAALEHAGYNPRAFPGEIGLFAGSGVSRYIELAMRLSPPNAYQAIISNEKDFLTTRTAYLLNLRGPALSVQTACSTSLVAVAMAWDALTRGLCDMALAGGVAVRTPQAQGYIYQEGMTLSPDGHCRPFDHMGKGTVPGEGVGAVVLKRLDRALADRDNILAVIRGAAVNNDGSRKVSYTAPSVEGQAAVVARALQEAGLHPEEIGYVEAHGTATDLGDMVEIAALTQAYRQQTQKSGYCAIGSIKSNMGHLEAAAGVAALIKVVLALQHRELPPSLNFEQPNPNLGLEGTPFKVNSELRPWTANGAPRRAGINAFGVGGTNAHLVVEQAPDPQPATEREATRDVHPLCLSARSAAALERLVQRYQLLLEQHQEQQNPQQALELPDLCFTANTGRAHFGHRMALTVTSLDDLRQQLRRATAGDSDPRTHRGQLPEGAPAPLLGFICSGAARPDLSLLPELYREAPAFREAFDRCAAATKGKLQLPLGAAVRQETQSDPRAAAGPHRTATLVALQLGLLELWRSWGVEPAWVMGQGAGAVAAAMAAGLLDLEDGFDLALIYGAALDASNASGATPSLPMEALQALLVRAESLQLSPARARLLSCVTGEPLEGLESAAELLRDQLSLPAQLPRAIAGLWQQGCGALVELGPDASLGELSRWQEASPDGVVAASLAPGSTWPQLFSALGQLWAAGVEVDFTALHQHDGARRVPLPTYPFDPEVHTIEISPSAATTEQATDSTAAPEEQAQRALVEQIYGADPTERRPLLQAFLSRIVTELTGFSAEQVARDDASFVALGVDSLVATQLRNQLVAGLGLKVKLSALFEFPTVASFVDELARLVDEAGATPPPLAAPSVGTASAATTARAGGHDDRRPLSYTQEKFGSWALEMTPAMVHVPLLFEVHGPASHGDLQGALNLVAQRHDMLRMRIHLEADPPYQRIIDDQQLELEQQVIAGADAEQKLDHELRRLMTTPFQLTSEPLVRGAVFSMPGDRTLLALVLHHLCLDYYAFGTVVGELEAAANALARGATPQLPPVERGFLDFVDWQRSHLSGERLAAAPSYWSSKLAGVETQLFGPRTERLYERTIRCIMVGDEVGRAVQTFCTTNRAMVADFMLGAAAMVVATLSDRQDVLLSTTLASRPPGTERTVGLFSNTMFLHIDLAGDPSVAELLRRVRDEREEVAEYELYPVRLWDKRAAAAVRDGASLESIYYTLPVPDEQVYVNVLSGSGGQAPARELSDDTVALLPLPDRDLLQQPVDKPLNLTLDQLGDRWQLVAEYARTKVDSSRVEIAIERFAALLDGMASDGDHRVSELLALLS